MSKQSRLLLAAVLSLALGDLTSSTPATAQSLPTGRLHALVPAMPPAWPGQSMKSMKLDQANDAPWEKGWTNLQNDVEQSFSPSLPKLMAVEVDLLVGNPGPDEDDLTLTVLDSDGRTLAAVTKPVTTMGCDHTMFVIPKHGLAVKPGQTYWLRLKGGTLFGWKYVVGGYEKGAATFNGNALLKAARSTFLFRTYGAD